MSKPLLEVNVKSMQDLHFAVRVLVMCAEAVPHLSFVVSSWTHVLIILFSLSGAVSHALKVVRDDFIGPDILVKSCAIWHLNMPHLNIGPLNDACS